VCNDSKIPLHLDGARLFNRLVASPIDYKTYGAQFDSISICLSKGLGAPIGSVLIGSEEFIHKARRVRKVMGGGMRQAGILAAAGIYALDHHVERLAIDHEHAKKIEHALQQKSWISSVIPVETNIVVGILSDAIKRDEVIQLFANQNCKIMAFGPGMIRMVTHLDLSESAIEHVLNTIKNIEI